MEDKKREVQIIKIAFIIWLLFWLQPSSRQIILRWSWSWFIVSYYQVVNWCQLLPSSDLMSSITDAVDMLQLGKSWIWSRDSSIDRVNIPLNK